jgi:hypothetical protein
MRPAPSFYPSVNNSETRSERLFDYNSSMRKIYDWTAIQAYHDAGHSFVECQRRFGFTHTAWNKALKRGELRSGQRLFADRRRRYDWSAVQRYYDEGHAYRQCRAHFGFNAEPKPFGEANCGPELEPGRSTRCSQGARVGAASNAV